MNTPRELQRIAKLLARAGVASRREIERMIEEGRIAVNGEPVTKPATLLASLTGVTVDGNPVREAAPARLFRYHKPAGLLTTERDPKGRPTIYDRLPKDLPRLMPVGRLDLNTEGLLLLTTDGEFKRTLELPATGVERSYRARVFGEVSQAQLEELIHGVEIEGVRYGAIDANLERRTGRNAWVEMRLREGKNREVRRVLEFLGLQVSRLIRTAYGPFPLADLPPGAVDEVRQHDLVAFRKALGAGRSNGAGRADDPLLRAAPMAMRPEAPRRREAPRRGEARHAPATGERRPPRAAEAATRASRPARPFEHKTARSDGTLAPRTGRPERSSAGRPDRADRTSGRDARNAEGPNGPRSTRPSRPGERRPDRSDRPTGNGPRRTEGAATRRPGRPPKPGTRKPGRPPAPRGGRR